MLKYGILGLGQAGSNISEYAITKSFKSIAINTAGLDLNLLKYTPMENRLCLDGYNGAGRNREIGKNATIENSEKMFNFCKERLSNCDQVFIAAAGGGGTGSGSLPVAIEILLEIYSTVNIIYILPDELESPSAKINSLDCFSEISQIEQLGSIFIIDNQKGKELNNDYPKFKVHQMINRQIIDLLVEINEFTDKVSYTNNFDERDMMDIFNTRGCTLITKSSFNVTKNTDDSDITMNIQRSWERNYMPRYELNNAVKCAILGKIKNNLSNKINIQNIFNDNIPYDIKDSLYTTNDEIATIYTIFSGLQFPKDRLFSIKEDVEKIQDNLVRRFESSQNQKMEEINWKINPTKQKNNISKDKSISLSEKLKKFK